MAENRLAFEWLGLPPAFEIQVKKSRFSDVYGIQISGIQMFTVIHYVC
jgi:hypothetical protein